MKKLLSLIAALAVLGLIEAGNRNVLACDQAKGAAHDCGKSCDCQKKAGAEKAEAAKAPVAFDKPPAEGTRATCPVTGEEFEVKADTPRSEYKGKHYVFCCPGCKPKFDADPAKYIK